MTKVSSFRKLALSALAALLCSAFPAATTLAADAPNPDEAIYFSVSGPAGLSVVFQVNGGSQSHRTDVYHTKGDGITKRVGGKYVDMAPASFDLSKAKIICATVVAPPKYFERSVCTSWGTKHRPADGVFNLGKLPI